MRELVLNDTTINNLLQENHSPACSLYLPVHGRANSQAVSEDTSRLNSMIKRLKSKLSSNQQYELRHRLDELNELVNSIDFWRGHTGRALAFFIQPDEVYFVKLPLETSEHLFVDTSFMIGPLLTQLIDDTRYYALCLSKEHPRLMTGSRSSMQETKVEDMPGAFLEALNIDELVQRQQQFHTGTGGGAGRAMFHGHGSAKDKANTDLGRYVRMIRDAVKPVVAEDKLPMILVGADKIVSEYRSANDYDRLLDDWVTGNYDSASASEIHKRTWPLMESYVRGEYEKHIQELEQLTATQPKRVVMDMEVIKSAALAGKIQKLFVTFTEKTRDSVRDGMANAWLERFYKGKKGKELSTALVEAWKHRGEIIFTPKLPQSQSVAAILRY